MPAKTKSVDQADVEAPSGLIDFSSMRSCVKLRRDAQFSDRIKGSFGFDYNIREGNITPGGTLEVELDHGFKAELSDEKVFVKRSNDIHVGRLRTTIATELGFNLRHKQGRYLSLSLEDLDPPGLYLALGSAVMIAKMPFAIKGQQKKFELGNSAGIALLKGGLFRKEWINFSVGMEEASLTFKV